MLWPYHMGALHPVEQVATVVLALGPFLILGAVILVRRRQDQREEERERRAGSGHDDEPERG